VQSVTKRISRGQLAWGAPSVAEQKLPRTSHFCHRACSERFCLSSSDRIKGGGGGLGRKRRVGVAVEGGSSGLGVQ
jgi:hypothetical protein